MSPASCQSSRSPSAPRCGSAAARDRCRCRRCEGHRRWPSGGRCSGCRASRRFSVKKVSASSISSVGRHFSTARKSADVVRLDAVSARGTMAPTMVSSVVLPHSGVGLVMPRTGEIRKQSWAWACSTHSATAAAAPFGTTMWALTASTMRSSSSAPSTGSGHGSGSTRKSAGSSVSAVTLAAVLLHGGVQGARLNTCSSRFSLAHAVIFER